MSRKSSTTRPDSHSRLWASLREHRADAFLTTALPNVRYLTGFTGSNAAFLLTSDRALLFTDPRYAIQAPSESQCEVKIAKGPLLKELAKWLKRLYVKRAAFEQNRLTFNEHEQLVEFTKRIHLVPVTEEVEKLRMVKTGAETATIRNSVFS